MKRILSLILILTILATSLAGCSNEQVSNKSNNPKPSENLTQEENTKGLPIVDRAGNEITLPQEINRIISMAPSITEIIVDLGYGSKIIAADTNSKSISGLPDDILFIDMMAPDAEQLVALNPDIIFASAITMVEGKDPLKPITNTGICVAYIPSSDSIEGIYKDIMFISSSLQENKNGDILIENMKTKIAEIKEKSAAIKNKKTVYFEVGAAPYLYSFGKGVFLNEMIDIIGAENIFAEQNSWLSISEEAVIKANPDVIITNANYIENPVDEIKSRSGWETVNAVKNSKVYYVDNTSSSLPNHNIIKAIEEMAHYVYPDIY